jgi:CrcB protein
MLIKALLVGLGGFLGALFRYLIAMLPIHSVTIKTITTNILGSFLIGLFYEVFGTKNNLHFLLSVGFLGAFTTFSAFSFGVIKLAENQRYVIALLYVLLTLLLCFIGTILGLMLGNKL